MKSNVQLLAFRFDAGAAFQGQLVGAIERTGGVPLLSAFVDGTEIAELTSELAAAAARAGVRPEPA